MILVPEPLTAEAFAPFGEVFDLRDTGRETQSFVAAMRNGRDHARLNVAISRAKPTPLPIRLKVLERHDASTQVFVPLEVARWLVVVCPSTPAGEPDHARIRAFVADGTKGMCYATKVWHHPFACIDAAAEMLMLRHDDGTEADTTWHHIPDDVEIELRAP